VSQLNVIRAWKDEEYRNSLSAAERAALPDNPAGLLETTEAELDRAVGGWILQTQVCTAIGCQIQTLVFCPTQLGCGSLWDCPTQFGCSTFFC
jgi:mersacidin/lichenicidin family type 2 lantibiotic